MQDLSSWTEVEATCPTCGEDFTGRLWQAVDVLARPDLLRRARYGTIHRLRCPHDLLGEVDEPRAVTFFHHEADLKILTSVPDTTSPDRIVAEVAEAVGRLRSALGDAWSEDWGRTAAGSTLASRLDSFVADVWGELPLYAQTDPLIDGARDLFGSREPHELEGAVRACPDLLDESAQPLLEAFEAQLDESVVSPGMRFVSRCRAEGVEAARAAAETEGHPAVDFLQRVVELGPTWAGPQDIAVIEAAIAQVDPESDPNVWALLHSKLGGFHRQALNVDRRTAIEQSVAAYEAALPVLSDVDPDIRGGLVAGLSNSLQERLAGDRDANYERAIKLCEACLEQYGSVLANGTSGALHDALGSALVDRPLGDRIDNIERALDAYQRAVDLADDPRVAAMAKHNFARTLMLRVRGDRTADLDEAISCYEESMQVLRSYPDTAPDVPRAAASLGVALLERGASDGLDVERAIDWLHLALEHFTAAAAPEEYAKLLTNLGSAWPKRVAGDRTENLERARQCFEAALAWLDELQLPVDAASVRRNLAVLLGDDARSTALADPDRSTALLEEALLTLTPGTHPVGCRLAAVQLGDLRREAGDLDAALDAYRLGVAAAEELYARAYVPLNQGVELVLNTDLYDRCVDLCLETGHDQGRSAVLYAEAGRARQFLDQMGLGGIPAPPGVPVSLVARENELLVDMRSIEAALAVSEIKREVERRLAESRKATRDSLSAVWEQIEQSGPKGLSYARLRRGESPCWEDLTSLLEALGDRTAVLSLYVLPDSVAVLVMRAGWAGPRTHRCSIPRHALVRDYLDVFEREVLNHVEFRESGEVSTTSWLELGDLLFAPVLDDLEGVELLYLLPHEGLHRIPLHALTVRGRPLIEHVAVAYAPSAAILQRTLARDDATPNLGPAFIGAYAAPSDESRVEFESEASSVAASFASTPYMRDALTDRTVLARMEHAAVVHLACHGYFDADDPLASGIEVAGGVVTARDLMACPMRADLVTLSACETGQVRSSRGDDIAGMARALLYAGANTALLTLWRVYSDSTLLWMVDFYTRWRHQGSRGTAKADAFRAATLALREKDPDVVAWSPFVLVGDWR